MNNEGRPSGVWFPAKRYGWGWGLPCTWQGWVTGAVWLVVYVTGFSVLMSFNHYVWAAVYGAVSVAVLVVVCMWKGEKPRWQWGDERSSE